MDVKEGDYVADLRSLIAKQDKKGFYWSVEFVCLYNFFKKKAKYASTGTKASTQVEEFQTWRKLWKEKFKLKMASNSK